MARTTDPTLVKLWQQRIDDQSQSGLSIRKFCELHEIPTYSFYFWRRRLAPIAELPSDRTSSGLVPVRIIVNQPGSTARIQFASGATLDASCDLMRIAIDQILVSERALLGDQSC